MGDWKLRVNTPCRCAFLQQAFGKAPPCGPCAQRSLIAVYESLGLAAAPREHLQAYRDCGVEPDRVPGVHLIWVPTWASAIVDALFNTAECGPILIRAVQDASFRAGVESLLRLSASRAALRSFAEEHGVSFAE